MGDSDIKGFLSKVDNVQDQLNRLISGELKPEDVRIPGERTPEEQIIFEKDKARRAKENREEKAKLKKDEHDKWWRGAEMRKDMLVESSQQKVTVEIEGQIFPKPKVEGKDCLDYSKWDKWVPDDPVSLAEMKDKVDKVDAVKNDLFEKNNPDFCNNFKEDMEKRENTKLRKSTNAERARQKGNNKFKKKEYKTALRFYKEALELTPYANISILTNMAQAHIKLEQYEEAIEFCKRALYMDEKNTKALSRRSLCYKKSFNYIQALVDLELANEIDPGNKSILKELKKCKMEKLEREAEDKVLNLSQEFNKDSNKKQTTDERIEKLMKENDETNNTGSSDIMKTLNKAKQTQEPTKEQTTTKEVDANVKAPAAPTSILKNSTSVVVPSVPSKTESKTEMTSSSSSTDSTLIDGGMAQVSFTMMDDAHAMFNKWWLGTNNDGTETQKELEENAKMAAAAVVPLLIIDDAMRIYFRRCGYLKTLASTLMTWSETQDQNNGVVSIETATKTESNESNKSKTTDEATEEELRPSPTPTNEMLITILSTLSAGCRNRLVQTEFVKDYNGLYYVSEILTCFVQVDQTKRSRNTSQHIVAGTVTNISIVRSAIELLEACTSHDTTSCIILKYIKNITKKNMKHLKNLNNKGKTKKNQRKKKKS